MESLQDPKVMAKFEEIKRTDKSFTKELRFMGLTTKYSQREARDIWLRGIAYGLEEGIRLFTIEGQRLDLYNSCKTAKQQEFLAKSFELCDRFGMQVVYSPTDGMVVVETGRRAVVVTPTPIEVSEFIKTRSEYQEELAQEYQGSFDEVSKGPFCDGCKHIGVNPESGPCAVCFEGMMYESDKAGTMENTAVADVGEKPSSLIETAKEFVKEMVPTTPSDPQYNARKKRCGKCANSSNPSACARCIDYSKFEPSRYR